MHAEIFKNDTAVSFLHILFNVCFDTGKILNIGSWLIILLDSRLENEHSGELTDTELEFLRTTLESNTDKHCLIALHHHPVSINSPWMDSMILKNTDDFLKVVDEFDNVRGIIWGHIHQRFECEEARGIRLYRLCAQAQDRELGTRF